MARAQGDIGGDSSVAPSQGWEGTNSHPARDVGMRKDLEGEWNGWRGGKKVRGTEHRAG